MNTMRSMGAAVTAAAALLVLGACSGGGSDPGPDITTSPAATSSTPAAVGLSTAPATVPLDQWLPKATGIMTALSDDLNTVADTTDSDPSAVPGDQSVRNLEDDAKAGLALPAPAGHPALDRSWDAVMNDCLLVAGDFESGDLAQAAADLSATGTDMDALQAQSKAL